MHTCKIHVHVESISTLMHAFCHIVNYQPAIRVMLTQCLLIPLIHVATLLHMVYVHVYAVSLVNTDNAATQ